MLTLRGHAIVVDVLSEDMGFRERITRQAVERSLARKPDLLALADHDYSRVLGRQSAGTLRATLDRRGLLVEIDPPDTTAGRDVVASVKRRDTRGMSFGFRVPEGGDEWEIVGEELIRTVNDMELIELSSTVIPAYSGTSIEVVESDDTRDDETVAEYVQRTTGPAVAMSINRAKLALYDEPAVAASINRARLRLYQEAMQ